MLPFSCPGASCAGALAAAAVVAVVDKDPGPVHSSPKTCKLLAAGNVGAAAFGSSKKAAGLAFAPLQDNWKLAAVGRELLPAPLHVSSKALLVEVLMASTDRQPRPVTQDLYDSANALQT